MSAPAPLYNNADPMSAYLFFNEDDEARDKPLASDSFPMNNPDDEWPEEVKGCDMYTGKRRMEKTRFVWREQTSLEVADRGFFAVLWKIRRQRRPRRSSKRAKEGSCGRR